MNPSILALASAAVLIAACSTSSMKPVELLPTTIQVPAGHNMAMETVGVGEITYQCRIKQGAASEFEWAFVGPDAVLFNRSGQVVGRYYGPPATWENNDGSKVTGKQLATAPAGEGNIPLQLVKANPAMGNGMMQGVTYIQRLAIKGGAAPAHSCSASNLGNKVIVKYQADYIFWKAA
ncbi:Protein of unknown function [Thiothrix eikelboomii]|uniref:DUF3455 domain-containing protein n=1 Tax=Thiothrix eikelboomii TaxID=92487 RepID=A0A1T4VTB5_9GAMM|nr:DUF3455 domain-containing protein [Thiothrix eikelboomii]SKA68187.1 Protein of unknown function [Thiothrix eikelboomii]